MDSAELEIQSAFDAGKRYFELERSLYDRLADLESMVGCSEHVNGQRRAKMPGIRKDYAEYTSLAEAYGQEPARSVVELFAAMNR